MQTVLSLPAMNNRVSRAKLMMYDPFRFILNALIQACQSQPPPASYKMVSLLEVVWDRLRTHQKVDLLGVPEVVSLLSDQTLTAKDLIAQVRHWAFTTKAACEHEGFLFEWDPEGFTWMFPFSKIQRPLSEEEASLAEYGIEYIHGGSSDFYALLVEAERRRLYDFRLRGAVDAQESAQINHGSEREVVTQEGKALDEMYASLAPRLK